MFKLYLKIISTFLILDHDVLLIGTGGERTNPFAGMQIVSLSNLSNNSKCVSAPPYPIAISGASSVVLRRRVIICGGQTNDGTALTKCYQLKRQNSWIFDGNLELRKPRAFSASLILKSPSTDRSGWWITGGRDGHNAILGNTEYV